MEEVSSSVAVSVSPSVAYQRWLDFDRYPEFMSGVKEVRVLDENRIQWFFGNQAASGESVSEIILRIPDRRLAWRTESGMETSGVVTFDPVEENVTRVTMKMMYDEQKSGEGAARTTERLTESLTNFKKILEASAVEDMVERNWQGF